MSQAKVDKHKNEKKNREKLIRKAKRRKVAGVFICAAIIGGIVGYPLGRYMYKQHDKNVKENAVVESANYDYWFGIYWGSNYSDKLSTATDASEETIDPDEESVVQLTPNEGTGTDAE